MEDILNRENDFEVEVNVVNSILVFIGSVDDLRSVSVDRLVMDLS